MSRIREFQSKVAELDREDIIDLIRAQDPELVKQVNRIEWVFKNKLTHLAWSDGSPVEERPLTNEELSLILDPPFSPSDDLRSMGLNIDQQRQIHIASDPVLWAKHFLNATPRVYQILMLRHPSIRKVLRAGRRLGKTYTMALMVLHYAYTHKNGRILVMAPMKPQVGLIYEEVMKLAKNSEAVLDSITRSVTSPQYEIHFSNGSTVRFFTTGLRSGGKSDVARGQEAHLIILDELDYMGPDDLDALYAMLQKTDDNQPDKILVGASTPTGRRERFWEWSRSSRFKEFWFPSYCFEAGQKITMADGSYRDIEMVSVGDFVLTESGPRQVTRTFERDYSGEMLDITTYGNNTKIAVTPEHPFSACDRKRKQSPSYEGDHHLYDWDWIESKHLKLPERRNQNSGTWLRYIYSEESNSNHIDTALLNPHLVNKDGRVEVKRAYQTGRKFINTLPSEIYFDDALATLVGWYLAEGSLDRYNEAYEAYTVVEFTLSKEELHVVDDLQIALDKLDGGSLAVKYNHRHNSISVRVNNTPLAVLLQYLCGVGSKTKKLAPEIMFAPVAFQDSFIRAYGNGDGWEHTKDSFDIRTSSGQLARQVRDIGARLGWISSISCADGGSRDFKNGYGPYECASSWLVEFRPSGRSMLGKRFVAPGEAAMLIKNIESRSFTGKVYNFEVEGTNSYLVEGLLVHNCNPHFDKAIEEEMRAQYNEMAYRHEIEADWGEDVEGVYPRKYVDAAFSAANWEYIEGRISARSDHLIGVDWDKYGAGPNIVVLEICHENYEDEKFANKLRVAYREEIPRNEYVLTQAVDRIIELNAIFNPKHIYVDRGYGDCVDPNTLISARHGLVPIKDIEPGHEVLSHDGDWHKVTGKIVREDPKNTFEVKVAKSLPVRVSDTHPFLCLTSDGLTEWKNVTEMQLGDYVALPKLSIAPEDSVIDIAQYMAIPDHQYDDEYAWSHNSNGNRIRIKRFVDLLSEDFLTFAGWYLSEGSSSGVQVEISQTTAFDLVDLMRSIEQVTGIVPSECIRVDSRETHYQDIRRIWITSKLFADFIGKLLGKGSANKKIPDEMMAYPQLLGPLLNGALRGDGHLYKTNSNYGYELSLTSFKLVDQIKLILNSVDIPVSSHFVPKRNESHSDQLKIVFSGCPEDTERFMSYTGLDVPNPERISRKSWKSDSEYLFLPIREINYTGKQSGLIDIEVEGAESFVGNGLILHNTQVELLAKYGVEHPQSGIKKKLKGVSFSQMIEMKDPATKQTIKKEMKPFMVDNLRTLLESNQILFPEHDEELYLQLISYVVLRTTAAGRPVFEASGSQVDHAHDALVLACLAYTQNYGDLMKVNLATRARSISNDLLLPMFEPPKGIEVPGDKPVRKVRSGVPRQKRRKAQRPIQRKTF